VRVTKLPEALRVHCAAVAFDKRAERLGRSRFDEVSKGRVGHEWCSFTPIAPDRRRWWDRNLSDSAREPWMVVPGDSSAIILANPAYREEKGYQVVHDWKTVSIQHMLEFSGIHSKRNGSQKRGKQ
jgi:hypothetical protein